MQGVGIKNMEAATGTAREGNDRALVIHAGASKTGSSALQVAFARNREWLASHGINYLRTGAFDAAVSGRITSGNAAELARYINGQTDNQSVVDQALHLLGQNSEANVLLSSEFFHASKPERLKPFIDGARGLGYSIKVVYFVRAYYDWLWSLYVQNIKNHALTDSFAVWVRRSRATEQYIKAIRAFDEAVGSEHVSIVNYDTANKDIFRTFVNVAFGLDPKVVTPRGPDRINRGLAPKEIELMRKFHHLSKNKAQGSQLSAMLIAANPDMAVLPEVDSDLASFISSEVSPHLDLINKRVIGGPVQLHRVHSKPAAAEATTTFENTLMAVIFKLMLDSQTTLNALNEKIDAVARSIAAQQK